MVFDRSNGIDWRAIAKVAGLTSLAVFAAIFIFWWGATLGAKSGYYGAQSQGYASQYPNDTDKRIEQCLTNPDRVAAKQCAQEAIAADRENQRGEHDLQAQREVADWTYYVLVISVLQIPLGVLGLIALLVTISQGREANEISREIGQAQSRAYLSIASLSAKKTKEGAAFKAVIKNSGQSPALAAQIKLEIMFPDGKRAFVLPEHEHQVPAQSEMTFSYCYFVCKDVGSWSGIVVNATVAYSDVFLSLHKIADKFGDIPTRWNGRDFMNLTEGMHIASYLRSIEEE